MNKQTHKHMNTYFDIDGMRAKNKCMKIDSNKAAKPKMGEQKKKTAHTSCEIGRKTEKKCEKKIEQVV